MLFKSFLFLLILLSSLNSSEISQTIKEKKIYPMGKKIYKKKCSNIKHFHNKDELNSKIKKSCKQLNKKHFEALRIYLWDNQNKEDKSYVKIIHVSKSEKCPICGMWVYKYPKWIAQLQYKDKHLSFDGVKDLMKYYLEDNSSNPIIVVREYYTQKALDAKEAFFVLGSDVYGPMGEELIPFKNIEDAKTFMMDHQGSKIVKFNEITNKDLY